MTDNLFPPSNSRSKDPSKCNRCSADEILGGLHVSLIRDFAQLPPVKDRPLYASPATEDTASGQLSRDGHSVYHNFSHSLRLSQVQRQQGNDPKQVKFRKLLKNASEGGLDLEDWNLLTTRYQPAISAEEQATFLDAVCLFITSEVVDHANLTQLAALNQPCARIIAKNEGRDAKKASSEDCSLEQELVRARGAKVMVTRNLWQTKGLVDDTLGTVVDAIWPEDAQRSDLPC
ncbi:hypothetical protein VNI00_014541 [Paramarasmius palmivorus]|uniref:Uncharacterized protein n=1 Tax=Paramarasmius palmivorus TaxID=297713 RepID=A0AAW0BSC8_9AGAR